MSKQRNGKDLLTKYLEERGLSIRDFCHRLGVSHAIVSRWLDGTRRPGKKNREAIERLTAGAVPAKTWLSLIEQEKEQRRLEWLAATAEEGTAGK